MTFPVQPLPWSLVTITRARSPFMRWFLDAEEADPGGFYEREEEALRQDDVHPWWKVMCLTGVDYFSTLGYQPGIAALAAGALAPIATLVLVVITLFGALPMYRRVAVESPHGDGSLSMLQKLLTYWPSKLLVLTLLGFVMTGFIITITLSAADATAHLVENPLLHATLDGHVVLLTLVLLLGLGAVFLKGFSEAIGVAVVLVIVYLSLSAVVVIDGLMAIVANPSLITDWGAAMTASRSAPFGIIAAALLVFPALALGLSGFETGVVVMPLIQGDAGDTRAKPRGRIRNAKKLLTTAACIMSVALLGSSFVTTLLIPPAAFRPGGEANGRALAYLAHERLGDTFGTVYDVTTVGILWFAGASALAGLLNIVPRYLPRYGMAPDWARSTRPLVCVFVLIAAIVTVLFEAKVDAQAAAYATGVLALMTSAAVAVFLTELRRRHRRTSIFFGVVSAIFVYTFVVTMASHAGGLVIALVFVALIMIISLWSRVTRSRELRVAGVEIDDAADVVLARAALGRQPIRFIANKMQAGDLDEYDEKERIVRERNHISPKDQIVFLEVRINDASDFTSPVQVTAGRAGTHQILRCSGTSVSNVLAAFLLYVRDLMPEPPHAYFEWSERDPMDNVLRFLSGGEGDIPPLTHEILRIAEPDPAKRPRVHVGG